MLNFSGQSGDEYKDIFEEVALSHGIVFREEDPNAFISVTNRIRDYF